MNFSGHHLIDRIIDRSMSIECRHSRKAGGHHRHVEMSTAAARTGVSCVAGAIIFDKN
jgi:hypothetical protein